MKKPKSKDTFFIILESYFITCFPKIKEVFYNVCLNKHISMNI